MASRRATGSPFFANEGTTEQMLNVKVS